MDFFYLGIVIFLIVLAVFDLVVGVSNDAVNFLNSAIGAKVARYRTIVAIAAINEIDLTEIILEKDKKASLKYNHKINLESYISQQEK